MEDREFTFIDLFSGIGGFRIAFERAGGECVFSSDIDKWANQTYYENFNEWPKGDITKIHTENIPDHDILCGGFPCQPFSIAGRRLGFADTRGTLFFEIERILEVKKPKAFLLENVRGLQNHNKGDTFKTILNSLKNLGYTVFFKVLNSKDFNVPQNRERLYIVGFKGKINNFKFPQPIERDINIKDILEENVIGHEITPIAKKHLDKHFNLWKEKKKETIDLENNPAIGNEIRPSRCLIRADGISPCLTAKMGTGGNNVPVVVNEGRKITVREALRIQGFPEEFKIKTNSFQSYKQIGNSVSVPVICLIAKNMNEFLKTI
jgi:DNA (cytosine-5)-methyltransferase 1